MDIASIRNISHIFFMQLEYYYESPNLSQSLFLSFWSCDLQTFRQLRCIILFRSFLFRKTGGIPYEEIEVTELVDQLNKGYRLSKPDNTSDEMYVV
jgi:hypothetical protein